MFEAKKERLNALREGPKGAPMKTPKTKNPVSATNGPTASAITAHAEPKKSAAPDPAHSSGEDESETERAAGEVIKQLAAEPTIPEIIEEMEDDIRGWGGDTNDPWETHPSTLLSIKRMRAGIRILQRINSDSAKSEEAVVS